MKHKGKNLIRLSQEHIQDIENERNKLLQSLDECLQSADEIKTEDKLKENIIKSLDIGIEDNQNNLESAREARDKEVELIEQSNHDMKDALKAFQEQYDESLDKIAEQNSLIRELQEKVADCEYMSQRNLRG